jgi:hypothetical protein
MTTIEECFALLNAHKLPEDVTVIHNTLLCLINKQTEQYKVIQAENIKLKQESRKCYNDILSIQCNHISKLCTDNIFIK